MKKNKKKNAAAHPPESDIINRHTRRQKETLERERLKNEKNRNSVFKKRVKDASVQKVPLTLRTKAYYRYSKTYPSMVDPEGFRENLPDNSKLSKKGRIILIAACICIFAVTLFFTQLGIELSEKKPEQENLPVSSLSGGISAEKITADFFIENTAEQIKAALKGNAFVLDIKNENGFIHTDGQVYKSTSASESTDAVREKLSALRDAGIESIAYISCFKDNIKPTEYTGMEIMTIMGEHFRDSDSNKWLNPFSDLAQDFLLTVIKNAADCGFSYILLDNVCFPTVFSVSSPYYSDSPDINSRNNTLKSFINKAVNAAGNEKLIISCDVTGFCSISELPNEKYGGTLLGTDCISFCLDLRADKQYTEQLRNSEIFSYIEEMPLAFVLDASDLAKKELINNKEAHVLFAVTDDDSNKTSDYIRKADIENIMVINN